MENRSEVDGVMAFLGRVVNLFGTVLLRDGESLRNSVAFLVQDVVCCEGWQNYACDFRYD